MTSVPLRPNWYFRSHALPVGWPSTCGGLNFQRRADWSAWFAKYLLGPGEVSLASVTFPVASTLTRTATRILPWIVLRAPCETFGSTCSATAPGTLPCCAVAGDAGADCVDD